MSADPHLLPDGSTSWGPDPEHMEAGPALTAEEAQAVIDAAIPVDHHRKTLVAGLAKLSLIANGGQDA